MEGEELSKRTDVEKTAGIPRACEAAERDFIARDLTDRERDAARSVLAGMTAEDAARIMGVSASSVGGFRRRAYHKLGVECARELALRYRDEGEEGLEAEWCQSMRCALVNRDLNETQADVLTLVAAGRSTPEIAEELHLAPGTVNSARSNGYRLLGIHSRDELVEMLNEEAAAPERRRRCARRIAVGVVAGIFIVAVCAALAWKFLPVDAFWEFVTGDVTGIENVNGVYYAVNKDGLTFGSIKRANLPIPWEDVTTKMSGWDSVWFDVWQCCPDLIATRTTLESSTEEGEAGYITRDDFIAGKEAAEGRIIVYDIRGREIGVLKYGRFEAR